ncbi:MAG: HD-GYP domain-containing protein [Caldisericota bacterium]|nr:HD-GYP domain-containing protein [Caldisericota bacterium]
MKKLGKRARIFIIFIYLLAITLFSLSFIYMPSWYRVAQSIYTVLPLSLLFIVFLMIADRFPIVYILRGSSKAEVSVAMALDIAIAFVFTPIVAMLVVAVENLIADSLHRKPWYKNFFNTSLAVISVGLMSIIFSKFFNASNPFLSFSNLLAIVGAAFVYFSAETLILFGLLSIINRVTFFNFWIENIKTMWVEIFTLIPLGIMIIYFFQVSPWMNLFLLPTFITIYYASMRRVQIEKETINALLTFAKAVDDRIPDTMKHSIRVANWTKEVCERLNLSEEQSYFITIAAQLHDIGKLVVPDSILLKPGSLTNEEFSKIKQHPLKGDEILNHFSHFEDGAKIIKHHHEYFNGKGYPDGLQGESIPLGARIISVADAFDAMISPRPYKKLITVKEALNKIRKSEGEQFDPVVAEIFCQMVREKVTEEEKEQGKREDFFPVVND